MRRKQAYNLVFDFEDAVAAYERADGGLINEARRHKHELCEELIAALTVLDLTERRLADSERLRTGLAEALSTCRELREYDATEIALLREALKQNKTEPPA